MAKLGEGIWRLRHTKDPKTNKWFNIFREVNTDDPAYKDTGTDEHGFPYFDTPIDWKRDYETILNLGAKLPFEEFKRLEAAAHDFKASPGRDLAEEAMKASLFGKLRAKRRHMEAGDIQDPAERARQERMAGAEYTASDAWGQALGRNYPKAHGDTDKARDVASKYETLGLIQGMVNQEPGANTRMRTLEPLLVGYIRNATPEQIAELNAYANKGDLDSILHVVGTAANKWGDDPNMSQYAFASAANRYNYPGKNEDIRDMGGDPQQVSSPGSEQTTAQAPYINHPQLEAQPTNTPNWGAMQQQQNPQQQDQPQPEQQFTGNSGWASPSIQQQASRAPQPAGVSATPGNFGNTLSSFATMYSGGVLPSLQNREPGIPPAFPQYGELLAAPTFQQAYMTLFKAMYDQKKFYQQQADAGLMTRQAAQTGIDESEKQFDVLKNQIYKNEIKWKAAENAKRSQIVEKKYDPITSAANTSPMGGVDTETDADGQPKDQTMHNAYDFVKDQWFLSRAGEAVKVAQDGLKKIPDLRRKLTTDLGNQIYKAFGINVGTGEPFPPEEKLLSDPACKDLVLKLAQLKNFEDAATELVDMYADSNLSADKSIPSQKVHVPRTKEQEDWLRSKLDKTKPHHGLTRFFAKIGLYGFGERKRRRKFGFLTRPWLGAFRRRKKPEKVSEKEWQQYGFLEDSLRNFLTPEHFKYVTEHGQEMFDGIMSEPVNEELNSAYEKYKKWLKSTEPERQRMVAAGEINEKEWNLGAALHKTDQATSEGDLTDFSRFGGITYGN